MQPSMIGTGWAFPPRAHSHGSLALLSGTELVEQAMRIILLTYPGERQMRPDFGSRLRDFVFAEMNADTIGRVGAEVRAALSTWEHRAEIVDVDVVPEPGGGVLHIDIRYQLRGTDTIRRMNIPFHLLPGGEPTETAED